MFKMSKETEGTATGQGISTNLETYRHTSNTKLHDISTASVCSTKTLQIKQLQDYWHDQPLVIGYGHRL